MYRCLCAPQDIVSLGAGEEGSCPAPPKVCFDELNQHRSAERLGGKRAVAAVQRRRVLVDMDKGSGDNRFRQLEHK